MRCLLLSLLIYTTFVFGDAIIPNQNLILEGMPELPTSLVEQTSKYTSFRATYLVDLHPEKTEMLVRIRPENDKVVQLHVLDLKSQKTKCLTASSSAIAWASYQPNDGKYCVFSKDEEGNEKYQSYRYDFDSGAITLLTDGVTRNSLGAWSKKGAQLAFVSCPTDGTNRSIYVIDPLNPDSRRLVKKILTKNAWNVQGWSLNDTQLLLGEYASLTDSKVWLLDIVTGDMKLLLPQTQEEKIGYSGANLSKDGKSLYVITDLDNEFKLLAKTDLDTGHLEYLTKHIPWDIESYSLSPKEDQIVFRSNENGFSKLYVQTLKDEKGEAKFLKNLPIGLISNLIWNKTGDRLYFNLDSARIPTEVFEYDLKTETLTQLTRNKALIDPSLFVEPELISWKSFDGREITGYLYRPLHKNGEKVPVKVDIHGGPESQFRPHFLGSANYFINELGVALLYPNIRGSTGYGKTFLDLPNGFNRVDAYEDINALLDWIKSQPDLDGERIMVSGGSYGGNVVLAVATRYNDKIACSLSAVGISNLVTFLENTEARRQDLRRVVYGDERIPEMRKFLESIAPVNHAKNIKKPIFIAQGYKDPRVPYSEAVQMVETLKLMNTPFWFLTAKNEGHGFHNKENYDYYFYAKIEFMKRYLLKEESQ